MAWPADFLDLHILLLCVDCCSLCCYQPPALHPGWTCTGRLPAPSHPAHLSCIRKVDRRTPPSLAIIDHPDKEYHGVRRPWRMRVKHPTYTGSVEWGQGPTYLHRVCGEGSRPYLPTQGLWRGVKALPTYLPTQGPWRGVKALPTYTGSAERGQGPTYLHRVCGEGSRPYLPTYTGSAERGPRPYLPTYTGSAERGQGPTYLHRVCGEGSRPYLPTQGLRRGPPYRTHLGAYVSPPVK